MKLVRSVCVCERESDSEGVGRENERGKNSQRILWRERLSSHRATQAMEYAGLLQPRGFWVNRESTAGLAWIALWQAYLTLLWMQIWNRFSSIQIQFNSDMLFALN